MVADAGVVVVARTERRACSNGRSIVPLDRWIRGWLVDVWLKLQRTVLKHEDKAEDIMDGVSHLL